MSRVVVISQLPPPIHGSTVMTRTFLETLEELGHDWRLVDRRFSSSIAEIGNFSLRKLFSATWMPFRLVAAMISFKPDVVVFFATNRRFSFLVDWVLSEVLRLFRVRRINYLHTVGFEPLARRSRWLAWMVSRLLRSAHTTICLGHPLEKDITYWVDESSVVFIPNTVADPPERLGNNAGTAQPLVLYLSNLIPEKGAGTFVDLATELSEEFPEAVFVVAGATSDRAFSNALVTKSRRAGLSSRLHFAGAVTDQLAKWRLLRDASVLVFPSEYEYEAFPLVLAEALACGTPVAAYRSGALAPVIEAASAGFIVDVGDKSGLGDAVRKILTDPILVAELADRAKKLFEREYTRQRFRDRWGALLSSPTGGA